MVTTVAQTSGRVMVGAPPLQWWGEMITLTSVLQMAAWIQTLLTERAITPALATM